jgi:putative membrane protein insertion efficiency factor
MRRALRELAVAPLRVYQRVLSPAFGPRCRFHPSCSEYAIQAIRECGILRGLVLAAWRVLRCNPFSAGGVDHVAARRIFRAQPEPVERASAQP